MRMRHDAAHLGAHAFDQHQVVRCVAALEKAERSGAKALHPMADVACRHLCQMRDIRQRTERLVAENRTPAPAFVRIEHIHCRGAKRCAGDDLAPDAWGLMGSHDFSLL